MRSSIGCRGQCWDNALAESFFAALKNELVYRISFPIQNHTRRAIAEYIEVFYNRMRIHSALGYKTPEVAKDHRQHQPKQRKTRKVTVRNLGNTSQRVAIFYTKVHDRLLGPLIDADQPPADRRLRRALTTIEHAIADRTEQAKMKRPPETQDNCQTLEDPAKLEVG